MSIYFNTNLMEARGLLSFNRTSNKISTILERLETGYRINSAKDDPVGLVTRELMRADIKGMEVALKNSTAANGMMDSITKGMTQISNLLTGGDPDNGELGLVGLLSDQDADLSLVYGLLDSIDNVASMTTVNGRQVLNGALAYTTQNLDSTKLQNIDITSAKVGTSPLTVDVRVAEAADKAKLGFEIADTTGTAVTGGSKLVIGLENRSAVEYQFADDLTAIVQSGATDGQINAADLAAGLNEALAGSGVTARFNDTANTIVFESEELGSGQNAYVYQNGVSTPDFNLYAVTSDDAVTGDAISRNSGKDALVLVNGQAAVADGNFVRYTSNNLSFSTTLDDTLNVDGETTSFNVTGGGTTFQLGKDVTSNNRLNFGLTAVNTSKLGGAAGTLNDIRTLNLNTDAGRETALKIANEAIVNLANTQGRIGSTQKNVLDVNSENLENQILLTTNAEAEISNTDVALETSRLARQELIAESAMNSILYSRQFAQFAVASLF